MNIYTEILRRIKDEIAEDPRGLGYSGKTVKQIKDMLNNPYAILTSSETVMSAPINQILAGLESGPNAIDETIINSALLYIGS